MDILIEILPTAVGTGGILWYMTVSNKRSIKELYSRTDILNRKVTQVVTYLKMKNGKGLD